MKTTQGVQLVPKNIQVSKVSFLADEDMLKAYQERIKTKYNSKGARKSLDVFTFNDGVIKGSNSFANVELASEHLATPYQVLYASELNPDFFRGNYEDLGLVLRTNGDSYQPNDHNAKHLYEQLKHRGITPTEESPVMIPLRGLKLQEDSNSSYGLVHLLTDESRDLIVQAPEFSHQNHGKKFNVVDERGVPIFDEQGTRTFYARQGGLGGVFLGRGLGLGSDWDRYIASSSAGGRVAVVENFSSGNK